MDERERGLSLISVSQFDYEAVVGRASQKPGRAVGLVSVSDSVSTTVPTTGKRKHAEPSSSPGRTVARSGTPGRPLPSLEPALFALAQGVSRSLDGPGRAAVGLPSARTPDEGLRLEYFAALAVVKGLIEPRALSSREGRPLRMASVLLTDESVEGGQRSS
jgi:hypothetical protein